MKDNSEYVYKSYANSKELIRGIERLKNRFYKPKFRTAKIKITTEEL
jgi:hypothetical protein